MMKVSKTGIDLIKKFEGCKLKAYQDGGGVWTIGYGTTGSWVKKGLEISQDTAERFLEDALIKFEAGVDSLVKVSITQNQFDALVCFAYNLGLQSLKNSTLLKLLNKSDFTGAAEQFLRWNRDNGRIVPGLARRREAEKRLFLNQ